MSYEVYKFKPGVCTCVLGDPNQGSLRVNVRKISGSEAVLDPVDTLRTNQFIYTTVDLEDGPSMSLAGFVVTSASGGIFVQWEHGRVEDADRVDATLKQYLDQRKATDSDDPTAVVGLEKDEASGEEGAPGGPEIKSPAPLAAPSSSLGTKVDVDASIRKKARRVRSAELASRVDTVQVLDMRTIKNLIKDAVGESIVLLGPTLGETERKRLLEEAEEGFKERMEAHMAEKAGLEAQTKLLQDQLEKAKGVLEEERNRIVSADQFTVSDVGMIEIEQRLGRLLDRTIQSGNVSGPLEGEMRRFVGKLLDDEREKIRDQAQHAQSGRISLLESKIHRLATSLQNTAKERDCAQRRARALESSGGLPLGNVLTAGLDEEDPDKGRKLALLKEIFKSNQEIREQLTEEGRLPQGVKTSGRPEERPQNRASAGGDLLSMDGDGAKAELSFASCDVADTE